MIRLAAIALAAGVALAAPAQAAGRLKMDDRASLWPSAGMNEKIDFTNRMGKSMSALSPDLDKAYFMRCLEETANIGDIKELTLSDMVRTCISLRMGQSPE